MRATQYLLATLKEIPKNCDTISHQLMIRAGMIRQISSGLYAWLPTGLRVLNKIKNIIRKEINKIGFIEIFMPITQPSNLWKQSGRWSQYGPELLRFNNRNNQDFILSPTHEEMISDLICKEVISHKQFPIQLYQIHTKYRDEARPRFGMIRAKEFIMKDGYSFHTNHTSLQKTYDNMFNVYQVIFNRIGLNFCVVQADPGKMGGILSHEFQAFSDYGEDKIAIPTSTVHHNKLNNNLYLKYNDKNILSTKIHANSPKETMRLIDTFNKISILELLNKLNLSVNKTIKIIAVQTNIKNKTNLYNFLGLIIRGDHKIDYNKLTMIPEISFPISTIDLTEIQKTIGTKPTLLNLINLSIPLIIDYNVAVMNDFIIESNINGKYFFGVNWYRDIPMPTKVADLCQSQCHNKIFHNQHKILSICNSIEIGHIFQLGKRYTNSIYSCIQKNKQNNYEITMGCYGIGVTRVIAAIIEQYYDKNGIVWPSKIAPFELAIIPINMDHSIDVKNISEQLYKKFLAKGIDVFIYDRKENPGIMFADMDLIGIPHVLIIGDRNLKNKEVEYKSRKTGIIKKIKLDIVSQFLIKKLIHT